MATWQVYTPFPRSSINSFKIVCICILKKCLLYDTAVSCWPPLNNYILPSPRGSIYSYGNICAHLHSKEYFYIFLDEGGTYFLSVLISIYIQFNKYKICMHSFKKDNIIHIAPVKTKIIWDPAKVYTAFQSNNDVCSTNHPMKYIVLIIQWSIYYFLRFIM